MLFEFMLFTFMLFEFMLFTFTLNLCNFYVTYLPPPPRRQLFREKNLRCPFFIRKVPLKAWPSQLLEASYAPDRFCGFPGHYIMQRD